MELGNIIPLIAGATFVIYGGYKMVKGKAAAPTGVAATSATGAAPAPTTPSTVVTVSKKKLSFSPTGIFGIAVGILILLMLWLPGVLAGEFFQSVVLTLIVIGVGLTVFSAGSRFAISMMILALIVLAFNSPEETIAKVETAKRDGISAAVASPAPARTVLRTTWIVGEVYVIHPGEVYEGVIPAAGIVFDQPAGWGVTATAHEGGGGTYEPAGTQKADPWGRVKVVPLPADVGKIFTVTASQ